MHFAGMRSLLRQFFCTSPPPLQTVAVEFTRPQPQTDLYVVGDVHGRSDLVISLAERLLVEAQTSGRDWRIIFVGDYIDRGEDSAAVLPFLEALERANLGQIICLMGNHEQMMLDFLQDPAAHGARWLKYGGLQTLASFGLRGNITPEASGEVLMAVAQDFKRLLPTGLLDWVRSLPLSFASGNVSVVHAGANPALPMGEQTAETLLWGHPNFHKVPRRDGTWIVHGHTIVDAPTVSGGRIALDTGAIFTGRLTAAAIYTDGIIDFAT